MTLFHVLGARLLFERPAHSQSIPTYRDALARSGAQITHRIAHMRRTSHNHAAVTYTIAIERWGQQRLRVAQGAGFRPDDYHVYRPEKATAWGDLAPLFEAARRGTVALAEDLAHRNTDGKILHELFGEMSVHAWLYYLDWHPRFALLGVR